MPNRLPILAILAILADRCAGSSARLLARVSAQSALHNRDVFSESGCQGDQMVLFIHQNLADMFGHRVLSQTLALPDSFTIIPNRCHLVLEIKLEHFLGLL